MEVGEASHEEARPLLLTLQPADIPALLDFLEERDLDEDTIVVYSSDHGDYACEHGIMEKAPGICSDAITRIPWIWRWPGRFKAGHRALEIVETLLASLAEGREAFCGRPAVRELYAVAGREPPEP